MRRLVWLFLPLLVIMMALTVPHYVWADETTPPTEVTEDDPATVEDDEAADDDAADDEAVTDPVDITAALDSVNATIDGLTADDAVKAQLKVMSEARLREAADRGFTSEQVQALADQMGMLYGQVDPARDLAHLNAACQFMIRAMAAGWSAEDAELMLAAKLAAGQDLKTALKEARFELKGKTPPGQAKKEEGKDNGGGKDNGSGKDNGKDKGKGKKA